MGEYRNRDRERAHAASAPGQFFVDLSTSVSAGSTVQLAPVELPDGWLERRGHPWLSRTPAGHVLPHQGWKIHVSASRTDYPDVLKIASEICQQGGIAYKFVATPAGFQALNSKYTDRVQCGKLITVYPRDDDEFTSIAARLTTALERFDGPYILTDVRLAKAPVFARFGVFLLDDNPDQLVFAEGVAIPDARRPYFYVPEFVEPPECLASAISERLDGSLAKANDELAPYAVFSSLHYSASGGVYLAKDRRDGSTVVLKEGRRHCGYSPDGRDGFDRVRDEAGMLLRLQGRGTCPSFIDAFERGDNYFLVEEYIEGAISLSDWIITNFPVRADAEVRADYYRQARTILEAMQNALTELHEAGVTYGDLSPSNVLVNKADLSCRLIDLESAGDNEDEDQLNPPFTPGFGLVRRGRYDRPRSRDAIALASMGHYVLWQNVAARFDSSLMWDSVPYIEEIYGPDAARVLTRLLEGAEVPKSAKSPPPRSFATPATCVSRSWRAQRRSTATRWTRPRYRWTSHGPATTVSASST